MSISLPAQSGYYRPRRDNLPRVLFRGYHSDTHATTLGLNSAAGIYPFAWQCLLPRSNSMVNRLALSLPLRLSSLSIVAVTTLASSHVGGEVVDSPYTSWTADFSTAVYFSLGSPGVFEWDTNEEPGFVAAVELSPAHQVIHVPDLGWESLPMEYLLYGPVIEGIRAVSIAAIRDALNCKLWPSCHGVKREPHHIAEEEIRDSMKVGLLFQKPEDQTLDISLIVAASLMSWNQVHVSSPRPFGEADLSRFKRQKTWPFPITEIQTIIESRLLVHNGSGPPLSGAPLRNPRTNTVGAPQLQLTIQLLTEMQASWQPRSPGERTSRGEWKARFARAVSRHSPAPHSCGAIRREVCGNTQGDDASRWLKRDSTYFCSKECQPLQRQRERFERGVA